MGVPPDDDDDDDDVLLYRAGHLCTAGRAYLVWEAVGVVGVYVHCVKAAMRTTASHSCRSHCTDLHRLLPVRSNSVICCMRV